MRGGSEGPNWILLAGGAAITALSYVIGRRQKHGFEDRVDDCVKKSGHAQFANHNDGFEPEFRGTGCSHQDSFGSVDSGLLDISTRSGLLTAPALIHGTSTRGLGDAFHANNHLHRQKSQESTQEDRTIQGSKSRSGSRTSSPPSTEFFEEERSFQRRTASTQEDVRRSILQGVQIGRSAKRDMVHRLRKQLKSRDEMILSMQDQIFEYERSLSLSDAHVSGLEARLAATSGVFFELDKEVHILRNQLVDLFNLDAKMEDCNEPIPGGDELTSCGDERNDVNSSLLVLKKLREVLNQLKEETAARDVERQSLSREHRSLLEKVDRLECALKEQGMLVVEKEQSLDMNQLELLGVTTRLQDMQHQLQAQVKEIESLRRSKAKLEACVHNLNSGGLSLRDLHSSEEIISSTSTEVSDSSSRPPGGGGDSELPDSCHQFEVDFAEDINRPDVNDSIVAASQQEVEQLSTAIGSKSIVVTMRKEQTARLVEDLQVEGTKDTMQQIWNSRPETLKSEEPTWPHLSQQLLSSTGSADIAQVNELSIKLIELPKFKQVEEEVADIREHQDRIAELRQKISNLTRDSIDEVRKEQSHHVAALIFGLAEKLAAQEEQAKQTALEVQQLSTSFQLLTPIVTKLQNIETDMPVMGESSLGGIHSNDVRRVKLNFSSAQPKHAAQDNNINKADTFQPGEQDADSSSDSSKLCSSQQSPHYMITELVDDHYQFRAGASGPLATKIRRFSSKWDGKNGRRKKPFGHAYGSGSYTDIITSGNWTAKSDGGKDLYVQEHVYTDVPHNNGHSLESHVEYQDTEIRLVSVEEEHISHNTWAVQQNSRYFPCAVEQVMAANTPNHEVVDFVPILEEFSPLVGQTRSPRQVIGSSRRYLFNSATNQGDLANSLGVSSRYSVAASESPLEEESSSEISFLIDVSEGPSISPFSKMVAQLDSNEELPATSSLHEASVELLLPDSPMEVVEDEIVLLEEAITPRADRLIETEDIDESETKTLTTDRSIATEDVDESETITSIMDRSIAKEDKDESGSELGSESMDSIDSEFDEMLDGTLDDLVKICSTTVTPASTPRSSVLSQNSGSKKFQNF